MNAKIPLFVLGAAWLAVAVSCATDTSDTPTYSSFSARLNCIEDVLATRYHPTSKDRNLAFKARLAYLEEFLGIESYDREQEWRAGERLPRIFGAARKADHDTDSCLAPIAVSMEPTS